MPDLGTTLKRAADGAPPELDVDALVKIAQRRTRARWIANVALVVIAVALAVPLVRSLTAGQGMAGRTHNGKGNLPMQTPIPGKRVHLNGAPPTGRSHRSVGAQSNGVTAGTTAAAEGKLSGLAGHFLFYNTSDTTVDVENLRTGRVSMLTRGGSNTPSGAALSPDSSLVAIPMDNTANGLLTVYDADGTWTRTVASMAGVAISAPTWSPDGSKILFCADGYDAGGYSQPSNYELWVVDKEGHGLRRFDEIPVSDEPTHPAWSPDGTKIAYESVQNATSGAFGRTSKIMTYDVATHVRRAIADGQDPSWSPDGRRIAYITNDQLSVRVLDVADGTSETLDSLSTETVEHPVFSPDGRNVAYARLPLNTSAGASEEIWIVSATDPKAAPPRVFVRNAWHPGWGP